MLLEEMKQNNCVRMCKNHGDVPFSLQRRVPRNNSAYHCICCRHLFDAKKERVWRCEQLSDECDENFCNNCFEKEFMIPGYLSWVQKTIKQTKAEELETDEKIKQFLAEQEEKMNKACVAIWSEMNAQIEKSSEI